MFYIFQLYYGKHIDTHMSIKVGLESEPHLFVDGEF